MCPATAFKTTSTKRRQSGFTLVELLIATGLGSLFMLMIMGLFSFSNRSLASIANYVSLERQSQHALDILSRDVRQVKKLKANSTTSLTFSDYDGHDLVYSYNHDAKTLNRTKDGQAEVLLRGCDELNFSIMQRNTQQSSFDQFPAASTATCKLLQLNWSCSRSILGLNLNTENMQSAKIVIRTK
jgi:prepilin-type N-terminal cleavage/methylation domain-containing protein